MNASYKLQAQLDISELLSWRGSDVVNWQDKPGPGDADLEAYWPSGAKWLMQVRGAEQGLGDEEQLGRLRLRANDMGALPVVAVVEGMQIEFRSALNEELLEVPEEYR